MDETSIKDIIEVFAQVILSTRNCPEFGEPVPGHIYDILDIPKQDRTYFGTQYVIEQAEILLQELEN